MTVEDLPRSPVPPKRRRIRALCATCPPRSAVICFDEWGPLELRPIPGLSWARHGQPARMRATYSRSLGTETFLGFYDVHADVLSGVFRKKKCLRELGEAFRRLRSCYPRRRLFVVLDNLHQIHDNPRFLALARRLRITLVFTPTEASWLNLIEPHFGVLRRATLTGSDDRDHVRRRRRIYRVLRYRHRKLGNATHLLTRIHLVTPIKSWRGTSRVAGPNVPARLHQTHRYAWIMTTKHQRYWTPGRHPTTIWAVAITIAEVEAT